MIKASELHQCNEAVLFVEIKRSYRPRKFGLKLAKQVTIHVDKKVIFRPDLWGYLFKYLWLKYRLSCYLFEVK